MPADDRDAPLVDTPAREGRSRRTTRTVLLLLLVPVLVVALAAGLWLWSLGRTFDTGTRQLGDAFPPEASRPAAGSAQDRGTTVLLLGADRRPEGAAEAGVEGERADTIMLVHLPEDGGELYVMSVLRDTWVPIPGAGEGKINSALNHGGVPLMVETVESLVGTRVDQVATVDFEGFRGLTDALGGVTIDVPQDFVSHGGTPFRAGPQQMDGETALEFVRERYAFGDGDFQRVQNQRTYVRAVLDKLVSRQTLMNPARIRQVVAEFSPYLEVSEGLTAGWIAARTPDLVGVTRSDIEMFTVPTQGLGTGPAGESIVVADEEALAEIGVAISGDKLDEYVATLTTAGP